MAQEPMRRMPPPDAIDRAERHWAIAAIEPQTRTRALAVATDRWTRRDDVLDALDSATVARVADLATAYDMAAVEAVDVVASTPAALPDLADDFLAAASRALTLQFALPVDGIAEARRPFRVLHVTALAGLAGRIDECREWERLHADELEPTSPVGTITARAVGLWSRIFDARHGDAELAEVAAVREELALAAARAEGTQDALALVRVRVLVHAASDLASYISRGEPADILVRLDAQLRALRASMPADAVVRAASAWLLLGAARVATLRTEQLPLPGVIRA